MSLLNIGDSAPAFSLKDQNGNAVTLESTRGKWTVLYFYPKALTPGCTTQACEIRDNTWLKENNITVLGVSADAPEKLKQFVEKEGLNFTLIGDPEKEMLQRYGAWQEKSLYGRKYMGVARMTYIVDPEGKIAHVMPKIAPKQHLVALKKWFSQKGLLHAEG